MKTTFACCFLFIHLGLVTGLPCLPGQYQNEANHCVPCSYIGSVSQYRKHWYSLARKRNYVTSENAMTKPEWDALYEEETQYSSRFSTSKSLQVQCGLTQDAVVCLPGQFYSPNAAVKCRTGIAEPKAPQPAPCPVGFYRNESQCEKCPHDLTTLYPNAQDQRECAYCLPGFRLVVNHGVEMCDRCDYRTCKTTDVFGGARAHRMTQCKIPCSPVHLHPRHAQMYACDIMYCFDKVQAQDIHSCVFDSAGNMRSHEESQQCHSYYRPYDVESVELMFPSQEAYIETIAATRDHLQTKTSLQLNPEAGLRDFSYFHFANNFKSTAFSLPWPFMDRIKVQTSQVLGNVLSSDMLINQLNSSNNMFVKTYDGILSENEQRNTFRADDTIKLQEFAKQTPYTDFTVLSYEYYRDHFLTPAMQQCFQTSIQKEQCSIYDCNPRYFTDEKMQSYRMKVLPTTSEFRRSATMQFYATYFLSTAPHGFFAFPNGIPDFNCDVNIDDFRDAVASEIKVHCDQCALDVSCDLGSCIETNLKLEIPSKLVTETDLFFAIAWDSNVYDIERYKEYYLTWLIFELDSNFNGQQEKLSNVVAFNDHSLYETDVCRNEVTESVQAMMVPDADCDYNTSKFNAFWEQRLPERENSAFWQFLTQTKTTLREQMGIHPHFAIDSCRFQTSGHDLSCVLEHLSSSLYSIQISAQEVERLNLSLPLAGVVTACDAFDSCQDLEHQIHADSKDMCKLNTPKAFSWIKHHILHQVPMSANKMR